MKAHKEKSKMKLKCNWCGHVSSKDDVYSELTCPVTDEQIRALSGKSGLYATCKKCGVTGIHTIVEE